MGQAAEVAGGGGAAWVARRRSAVYVFTKTVYMGQSAYGAITALIKVSPENYLT